MTESFWESEVMEETQQERQEDNFAEEATPEQAQEPVAEQAEETSVAALNVDEFSALEERILRTVNLVKRERQDRVAAEERASVAEAQLREVAPRTEKLEQEVSALHGERDQVRQRVERLLSQLDALEL